MNIFKLGIRSVIRKPVKSILLFLLVFFISIFIYAGWACQSASVVTQEVGRQAIGSSFRLEGNEENRHTRMEAASKVIGLTESGSRDGYHQEQLPNGSWRTWVDHSFETLVRSDINEIAQIPGISEYNITTTSTVVNPVNFIRMEDEDVDQTSDFLGVTLRGNLDMKYDFDVQRGNITIADGRLILPEDEDVCVISNELANRNALKIGDVLQFNSYRERENPKKYSAKIVGTYKTIQKMTQIMSGDTFRSENIIFTDLNFPEKAEGNIGNPLYQYATFHMENVNAYKEIKEEIRNVPINWERYDLLDNSGLTDTMAGNFNDLSKVSSLLLIFTIGASVLILFLIFLFWMKNRIHEIGILLSMGRRKWEIISQILFEGLLIGIFAFSVATVNAPYFSTGVAEYLVGDQVVQEEEKRKSEEGFIAGLENESKSQVVAISIKITKEIIFISGVSVIGIIFVSILISAIYIVLQKPKEILSKMS